MSNTLIQSFLELGLIYIQYGLTKHQWLSSSLIESISIHWTISISLWLLLTFNINPALGQAAVFFCLLGWIPWQNVNVFCLELNFSYFQPKNTWLLHSNQTHIRTFPSYCLGVNYIVKVTKWALYSFSYSILNYTTASQILKDRLKSRYNV